ncbi:hypothetical protein BOTBODRAFT_364275 [Botryobasidium botryosum FD-172 SS1]|uniref:SMC hinge domain-containing protein n=1 Tax=Botryobasidium botryosum (strain FD-172 SS1) TaxID=930990 RepID=A0A067MDL4_BOTB1|nr:hypothetical protein BOTBODRAFT_364275 [Botryobasidium botryosum FD-172 SS1]
MRIEELVIEGFKSYPVRTQITGWDPSFNAITGLNGSGKSNILDAICFVLGITNMQQMRAQNQQDLIYKRGQAGVTKASVTIVFDNSDRSTSPVGFEACKQITVTRQVALPNISKYLLNGHKSQQQHILTLFQSVQLNINNPNFVIMQGRITKVLNMRPQEILGMVEEAAGTRMFEERKEKAKRTMGKKEKRVEEITSLLDEEITPKLDTLRSEKRSFLSYQKACSELEKLSRVLRASEWADAQSRVQRKGDAIEQKRRALEAIRTNRETQEREAAAAEKERARVEKVRDREIAKGGKLKALEEEVMTAERELARFAAQVEIKQGTIDDEKRRTQSSKTALDDLNKSLVDKRAQVDQLKKKHATLKETHSTLQERLATAEELLQTLLTGLSSSATSSNTGGYLGQLAEAKNRLTAATTAEEQARMRLAMVQKELDEKERSRKKMDKEAGDGSRGLEKAHKDVEKLARKLENIGWDAQKEQDGNAKAAQLKENVRVLTEQREVLSKRLAALDFTYSDPTPNFDRTKVKGLVATLIDIERVNYSHSTALEICAGAKLYNVVVENERVGGQLLQNGKLKKRVTIIPLNKINAFKISAQKLAAAQELAPGKARLALSLVGYPEEVSAAMTYVFGDTIICADSESAKAATFNKSVGVKSVTLDGDVYDPSGMLSGGSAPSGSGILLKVQELKEVENKLRDAEGMLRKLEQDEEARAAWKTLTRELELKQHELRLLEEQVNESSAHRLDSEVQTLKASLVDLKETIERSKEKQKEAQNECKKLEQDMNEFKKDKGSKLKELKGEISSLKTQLSQKGVAVKAAQKELQTAELELEQTEKDIASSAAEVQSAIDSVGKTTDELKALLKEQAGVQTRYNQAEEKLKAERADLSRFDDELNELEAVIKEKKQAISDADLEIKDIEHQITSLQKERTAAQNLVANLEKQNPGIENEQHVEEKSIPQLREKAKELEDMQKGMKKKINPKVINMIDRKR